MSHGQNLLKGYLETMIKYPFIENHRPDWLEGLELDFYFPDVKVGIEFQGDQHYYHTSFGSPYKQKMNDKRKHEICRSLGIKLYKIQAIDLEYTKLRSKFKKANKKFLISLLECDVEQLKTLNKESTSYRKILREFYDSPTTARKKTKTKADLIKKINIRYK